MVGVLTGLLMTAACSIPSAGASQSSVISVVKVWSPNHAKYCAASTGLSELWDGAIHKPATARWELTYFEDSSVYAPTRLVHTEIAKMAVAFSHLMTDAGGLKLFTRHPEWAPTHVNSEDPIVRAFETSLAPYDTVHATALTYAVRDCSTLPAGTAPNIADALTTATTAYYVNVAKGHTRSVTIAQYAAALPEGNGERVVASGSHAKFTFTSGAPVCITRPAPTDPPPKVVAC